MTIKKPYYARVPYPADIEAAIRMAKDPRQQRGEQHFQDRLFNDLCADMPYLLTNLPLAGRRIEAEDVLKQGAVTRIGRLIWTHEEKQWHCWKEFGQDGWLLIDRRSEKAVGRWPRAVFAQHLSMRHEFANRGEEESHEQKQRQRGLKLTAEYRRNYERKLAEAKRRLSASKSATDPKKAPPRPKM